MRDPNQSQKKPTFMQRVRAHIAKEKESKLKVKIPKQSQKEYNREERRQGGFGKAVNRVRHLLKLEGKAKHQVRKLIHPCPPVPHKKYKYLTD